MNNFLFEVHKIKERMIVWYAWDVRQYLLDKLGKFHGNYNIIITALQLTSTSTAIIDR